jgi:fimbrial chaperone protein
MLVFPARHLLPRLALVAVVTALAATARPARAGALELSPVIITLTPSARSRLVEIRNEGTQALRLQVSAYGWSQTAAGEMELVPTSDVVFFPMMLVIPSGTARKVRVGVLDDAAEERSYRLAVTELPPAAPAGDTAAPRALKRMLLPIFVRPEAAEARPRLSGVSASDGQLRFEVHNDGAAHMTTRSVRVAVADDRGRLLAEQDLPGWYVLAHGTRQYALRAPSSCAPGSAVIVNVVLDSDAGQVTARSALPCGSRP